MQFGHEISRLLYTETSARPNFTKERQRSWKLRRRYQGSSTSSEYRNEHPRHPSLGDDLCLSFWQCTASPFDPLIERWVVFDSKAGETGNFDLWQVRRLKSLRPYKNMMLRSFQCCMYKSVLRSERAHHANHINTRSIHHHFVFYPSSILQIKSVWYQVCTPFCCLWNQIFPLTPSYIMLMIWFGLHDIRLESDI